LVRTKDAGKEIVKGLLKALIDSQLDRQGQTPNPRGHIAPPPGRPQPGQNSPQMQNLRLLMASVVQEASVLTAMLNTEARRSFEIRRLQADALRWQAKTISLKQHVDREHDPAALLPDFLSLNADWKTLSHQLLSCSSLSPTAQQGLARLSRNYSEKSARCVSDLSRL